MNPFSRRWYGFHNATLASEVRHGYQALSIDDNRKVFKPEIWDETSDEAQTIEQVWFAGVHSNIGGGYRRTELSDICLDWMIEKSRAAGLSFWPNYKEKVLMHSDPHGKIYDPREGFGRIYSAAIRSIPDNARIHESVFKRMNREDNRYSPQNIPDPCIRC